MCSALARLGSPNLYMPHQIPGHRHLRASSDSGKRRPGRGLCVSEAEWHPYAKAEPTKCARPVCKCRRQANSQVGTLCARLPSPKAATGPDGGPQVTATEVSRPRTPAMAARRTGTVGVGVPPTEPAESHPTQRATATSPERSIAVTTWRRRGWREQIEHFEHVEALTPTAVGVLVPTTTAVVHRVFGGTRDRLGGAARSPSGPQCSPAATT